MQTRRINPLHDPLREGESWWIVHPNQSKSEFKVPAGGITVCIEDFESFTQSVAYTVLGDDPHNGWITVKSLTEIIEMPYYVFARYFDAEAFVRGILEDPSQIEKATPFDYKSTLPADPRGRNCPIENFEDGRASVVVPVPSELHIDKYKSPIGTK